MIKLAAVNAAIFVVDCASAISSPVRVGSILPNVLSAEVVVILVAIRASEQFNEHNIDSEKLNSALGFKVNIKLRLMRSEIIATNQTVQFAIPST